MTKAASFPLSPANSKRLVLLLAGFALAVIVSDILYISVSGDRRFPAHLVFTLAATGLCAWGIWARYRWAWALTIIFAAWQIYDGLSHLFVIVNAAVQGPPAIKVMAGLALIRTLLVVLMFVLFLFSSDRR